MSKTVAETSIEDARAAATLHASNAEYLRALVESDTAWYDDRLSDDFVCTLGDGRRIDKTQFLERTAEGPCVSDVRCDDVEVCFYGDVQGVTHFTSAALPLREGIRTCGGSRVAGRRGTVTPVRCSPRTGRAS